MGSADMPRKRSTAVVTTPPTILAVDDSLVGLHVRKILLEHAGYKVLTASDGAQGLALFETHPVDLVLMDYFLPQGGGGLRQKMKAAKPHVPIVVLSGITELPEDLSNVDLFLSKLDPPGLILDKIAELVGKLRRNAA